MGQAKARGSYQERVKQALDRENAQRAEYVKAGLNPDTGRPYPKPLTAADYQFLATLSAFTQYLPIRRR